MDKALVVGIGLYDSLTQDPLPGAIEALASWTNVLTRHYGFRAGQATDPNVNLHTLQDQQATKEAILDELGWLAIATESDRLVYVHSGHGTVIKGEQGLVTYPGAADTLETAALFGYEVLDRIRRTSARVLVVLDTCFAAGVFRDLPPLHLRAPYIDASAFGFPVLSIDQRVSTFVSRLTERRIDAGAFSIVVASAARELEAACEGEVLGKRRMFFSFDTTELLNQYPDHSYDSLYKLLVPMLNEFQHPMRAGDDLRYPRKFTY